MIYRNTFFALAASVAIFAGCDWGGVSSDESWNDAYSWLNFSGTYRMSVSVSTDDSSSSFVEKSMTAKFGVAAGTISASGKIDEKQGIVFSKGVTVSVENIGSATVTAANTTETNGSGASKVSVKVSVDGHVSVKLVNALSSAREVTVTYTANVYPTSTPGSGTGSVLTTLNVHQTGNNLSMSDNNGVSYSGKTTSVNLPKDGFSVAGMASMSFEVKSAAGAKIVGSLRGDWSGAAAASSGRLSNRVIDATYFPAHGSSTAFVGTCDGSASLSTPASTTTVSE